MKDRRNPAPTVDIILIRKSGQVALIERRNPPLGWALPGGFVDYGESCEEAARREAREELSTEVVLKGLVGVYSDPKRDPRGHTISVVYEAIQGIDEPIVGADDARTARWFSFGEIPWSSLCFDHGQILRDYLKGRE